MLWLVTIARRGFGVQRGAVFFLRRVACLRDLPEMRVSATEKVAGGHQLGVLPPRGEMRDHPQRERGAVFVEVVEAFADGEAAFGVPERQHHFARLMVLPAPG